MVIAVLIAAVAVVAVVALGGGGGYHVRVTFQSAGQLVKGNPVRVGGGDVGRVTGIELDERSQAVVSLEIDDDLAPLHSGTTATVRVTSLIGVANRYVSLQPGPNNAPELEDGGSIGADDTSAPVDFDQLINSFDDETRAGLRRLIRGSADWYDGRAAEADESTRYVSPALAAFTRVSRELARDEQTLAQLVRNSADTVSAIAGRRDDLAALVANTNTASRAIADENVDLDRALGLLPGTLRKANTTFVNLRSTLDDLGVLVQESKPTVSRLEPLLGELRQVVREARPTVADLSTLLRRPGDGNDLTELIATQPRLARLTTSVFPRAIRTLDRAQPIIEHGRPYTPDLTAALSQLGAATAYYDANGHYARLQAVYGVTRYSGGSLTAVSPDQRLDDYEKVKANRCPGGATQPPPDGSAPLRVPGCDPSTTPPGP